MQRFRDVVTKNNGQVVAAATVTVRDAAGSIAALYADNGATAKSNPTTTDENGEFSFYAPDGTYTLTVSKLGIATRTVEGVQLEDAPSGAHHVYLANFPGADPTGVSNSSAAMAAAIAAATAIGACDILIGPGRWLLDPFSLPSNVNLVGTVTGPFDCQAAPASATTAPTLLVNSNGASFIKLNGYKSSLHNLLFYYPTQVAPTAAAPTVFNPTVEIPVGQGGGHRISGCTFVNSYDAIKIGTGRATVDNCIIGAYRFNVLIDEALDWVNLSNVMNQVMWDVYAGLPYPQNIDAWVLNNGVALSARRVDSLVVNGLSVFSKFIGMEFADSSNGGLATRGGYGRLTNVDLDYVAYGISATSTNNTAGGYTIDNMTIGVNNSGAGTPGQASIITSAGGTMTPQVTWRNGSVRGTWAAGSGRPLVNAGSVDVSGVRGVNDVGVLPTPAVPASTVARANPYPHDVRVGINITGGTMTACNINASGTGLTGTSATVILKAGESITVTYSGVMTWAWFAM